MKVGVRVRWLERPVVEGKERTGGAEGAIVC